MCWQDLVIARRTKSRVYKALGGTLNIPGNGNRVGLWLSADTGEYAELQCNIEGENVAVMSSANSAANGGGFFGYPPSYMSIYTVGDFIYNAFILQPLLSTRAILIETYIEDPADVQRQVNLP